MMKTKHRWLIGTLITLVAAGGGFVSWFNFFGSSQYSKTFEQKDFNTPLSIPLKLDRAGTVELEATAGVLTHNPHYGQEGWLLGSGVSASISVNGVECSKRENVVKDTIADGRKNLSVSIHCSKQLPAGNHTLLVSATFIGNCKKLHHNPETCNTNTIRGSYVIEQFGIFGR